MAAPAFIYPCWRWCSMATVSLVAIACTKWSLWDPWCERNHWELSSQTNHFGFHWQWVFCFYLNKSTIHVHVYMYMYMYVAMKLQSMHSKPARGDRLVWPFANRSLIKKIVQAFIKTFCRYCCHFRTQHHRFSRWVFPLTSSIASFASTM